MGYIRCLLAVVARRAEWYHYASSFSRQRPRSVLLSGSASSTFFDLLRHEHCSSLRALVRLYQTGLWWSLPVNSASLPVVWVVYYLDGASSGEQGTWDLPIMHADYWIVTRGLWLQIFTRSLTVSWGARYSRPACFFCRKVPGIVDRADRTV